MSKRSYGQNCALARAGDVIGERWTLLLVRDLLVAPRRYGELQASLQGIGSNLLSTRLRDLEAAGLIQQDMADDRRYALTDRGRALEPAVLALVRWGMAHAGENAAGDHHRDDWDLLALKALFQPDRAAGLDVCVSFATADFLAWVAIADGRIRIGLGEARDPGITVGGTVADLFLRARAPKDLQTGGDPAMLTKFMRAFALRAG